ncbi:MAG TPA: multicopper oxidase domain-containing protein, partial [Xanthomonadaceae bacterium]|nr:multicopper oxidase domain-containing protein [Xanthomonadaceae bacterium]
MSFDSLGRRPGGPAARSRRRFVQGLAAGGAVAGLGLWPRQSWAMQDAGQPNVLSGTHFKLDIGETPMNFTGLTRPAITVNGSLPAPLLRWREGDTVTLDVANRLPQGSIHGHQTSI